MRTYGKNKMTVAIVSMIGWNVKSQTHYISSSYSRVVGIYFI